MSKITNAKPFQPLLPVQPTRPASRWHGASSISHIIRDQFALPTWLALGAVAQGPLYFLLGRLAFIPAFAFLLFQALDAYAQATGWKSNSYMKDVVAGKKMTAVFPDQETGEYGTQAAKQSVVVLLIGTRTNHPMGLLAPGVSKMNGYFQQMAEDLDKDGEQFGFLGMSAYLNINDRTSKSEILSLAYFRTTAGLHAFAHSDYHRGGWNWWNKTVKEHPHLSIYHEIFETPNSSWESIYINSNVAGILATQHKVPNEEGEEVWKSPVVDSTKGVLKTSAGRMGRSEGLEHEGYAYNDVYEKKE